MKKVLVTYFEKFSNHEFNSTQILPTLKIDIENVDFVELPVGTRSGKTARIFEAGVWRSSSFWHGC